MMKSMKFVSEYSDVPFEIDLFNDNEYVENLLNLDYDTDYIDIGVSYCKVEWEFTIETREWGVKTLSAYATNVSLELNCEWYDEDDNDYEKQLDIDLSDWEINSNTDEGFNDNVSVRNVEFNFEEKTINVEF